MTSYSSHFLSYHYFFVEHRITIVDGSHSSIVGSGNITLQLPLQPFIHLNNVLHVPKLSNNLIFIHKLTKDLNCAITFFHSHRVFQDLATGNTIGVAKE